MSARSLLPKRDEFLSEIAIENPGLLPIAEFWINSSHLMVEFAIEKYETYHKKRMHTKGDKSSDTPKAVQIEKHGVKKYDTVNVKLTTTENKKSNDCDCLQTLLTANSR